MASKSVSEALDDGSNISLGTLGNLQMESECSDQLFAKDVENKKADWIIEGTNDKDKRIIEDFKSWSEKTRTDDEASNPLFVVGTEKEKVTINSVKTLLPNKWINDEIINCFSRNINHIIPGLQEQEMKYTLIDDRAFEEKRPDKKNKDANFVVLTTFFSTRFMNEDEFDFNKQMRVWSYKILVIFHFI